MPKLTLSPPPEGWTEESEQKRLEDFRREYPWPIGAYRPLPPKHKLGRSERQPSNTPFSRNWPRKPTTPPPRPPLGWKDEEQRQIYFAAMGIVPPPEPDPAITPIAKEAWRSKYDGANKIYERSFFLHLAGGIIPIIVGIQMGISFWFIVAVQFIVWLSWVIKPFDYGYCDEENIKRKYKGKQSDEQMATLAELFEEAEVLQRPEAPPPQPTVNQMYKPMRTTSEKR
ncbi:hypothetical protein LCGC14_2384650 [marine sediment metagenome]|uniref:Uncharacterized protein n=1 Tax=marine sediment metagenome TaxID=412755 RepID=A0A0F9EC97_9ZZZZ